MKVYLFFTVLFLTSIVIKAQVDTITYDDGSYCVYDKSFRPAHLQDYTFYRKNLIFDKENNRFFRDYQICYTKENIIEYEFKYLSDDKRNYVRRNRNKNGVLTIQEIALFSDTSNTFIQEKYWTDTGELMKEDTWKKDERVLLTYHLDESNSLKSISKWKEVEKKDTLYSFEDKEGYYWIEKRNNNKSFVPIGIHYEFYPNGLLKNKGEYKSIHFNVFKSLKDYKIYQNNYDPKLKVSEIDNRIKMGVWEYYSDNGELIRTEKND